jgi:hypothetical protein
MLPKSNESHAIDIDEQDDLNIEDSYIAASD